ncbi:MGMT family protein [Pseudonocardia sp. HH130630-07]|uniref:MGMT family protein n=1 Tax=Pseudonocardia sp. HH130630-07 TaxID=1690815 RepID=UPI000814B5A3|nr:MGMT family protein [Pseudonocardia sp. HH130630-07]ANY05919.1 DNA methyltransferase [Pseudonocardia sp. HH130630-07]
MDDETVERVRAVVLAIPPGQTLSYGEVAELAGLRSARLVGRILAEDGADLPWHRVLRADGRSAPHIADEQAARLRTEGILMVDGRLPREHRRRS